jgi:hypothetical protein
VSPQTPFGIITSEKGHLEKTSSSDVKMYISGNEKEYKGGTSFIESFKITKGKNLIDCHKVLIGKAGSGSDSFPHSIIFVFDGSSDEIIQKEDETFYKELIEISKKKGYENIHIHVILTRIDIFEKLIFERNKLLPYTERSSKFSNLKDEKIEKVIDVLGVNRSNIHFIENYHDDEEKENSYEIDYSLLKTMCDIINSCELYILNYIHRYETCFNSCFG